MLLLPALAAASSPEPPRSMLPLITRLQQQYGPAEAHRQRYRRLETEGGSNALTTENTDPIRIKLNFDSLYEATAPEYSACFTLGAWFKRGLPAQKEPPGVETCTRASDEWLYTVDDGCWGICKQEDLITEAGRTMVIDVVTKVAEEFSAMLGLLPVEGALTFKRSKGSNQQAQLERGYEPVEGCAVDCTTLSQVHVDDKYCDDGVEGADVVLSVTKPPVVPGVAGSGSHCATDHKGRPTWLVFSWLDEISSTAVDFDFDLELQQHRALVTHELLHSLGFGYSMFVDARDPQGDRKGLIELRTVIDKEGTAQQSTDKVWHFVKGRAYELGMKYFGCDNSSQGLPLMGKPELGRASHWETRIMRDDVMSYGHRATVSGITLAALEDLGYYLANYSAAHCMTWGYGQGCKFVSSRCEASDEGQVVAASATSSTQCEGDPYWPMPSHHLSIITDNCQNGNDPCGSLALSNYNAQEESCNAECVYPPASDTCTAAPTSDVAAAGEPTTLEAISEAYMQWIWLGVLVLGAILLGMFGRYMCCPPKGSRTIALWLSSILLLLGLALLGVGIYARFYNYDLFSAYVGYQSLYGFMGCGGGIALLSLLSIFGLCRRSGCTLLSVVVLIAVLVVAELALVGFIIYWIWALQDVSEASADTLYGDGDGRWEGRFGEDVLAEIENLLCRTYVKCCRDPALDGIDAAPNLAEFSSGVDPSSGALSLPDGYQTCYGHSESLATDFKTALKDPSSKLFCPYVSGTTTSTEPPSGVCDALDTIVGDFDQDECQKTFCTYGADGYIEFVNIMTDFVRTYATAIGGVGCVLILVEMVWLVNLWNLRTAYRQEGAVAVQGRYAGGGALKKHSLQNSGIGV